MSESTVLKCTSLFLPQSKSLILSCVGLGNSKAPSDFASMIFFRSFHSRQMFSVHTISTDRQQHDKQQTLFRETMTHITYLSI